MEEEKHDWLPRVENSRNIGLAEFFAKTGLSRPRTRPSQGESLREPNVSLLKRGVFVNPSSYSRKEKSLFFPLGNMSISYLAIFCLLWTSTTICCDLVAEGIFWRV